MHMSVRLDGPPYRLTQGDGVRPASCTARDTGRPILPANPDRVESAYLPCLQISTMCMYALLPSEATLKKPAL